MTNISNTNLIAPPQDEALIYPYRRVWISIVVEFAILILVVLITIVAVSAITIDTTQRQILNWFLTFTPLGLWAAISWTRETLVAQPRPHLLSVVIVSALVANAVAYPLLNDVVMVDQWITRSSLTDQLLVYIFGFGVIQEVLKALVIRHTVWIHHTRNRYDVLAYAIAGAIAYSTVLNIYEAIGNNPPANIMAIHVVRTLSLHIIGSLIVAYGLAETRLTNTSPFLTLGVVSIASVITGIIRTLQNNITNTRLGFDVSTPRNLLELIITILAVTVICFAVSFLVRNAERQESEAATEIA
jgi:RsiW-degrading membrane proteinase PrsW (M82 family)